jgi:flagellar FliJ protein
LRRFRFNLEKILSLRKYREREAEVELGRAVGALADIENKIALLARERVKAADERFSPHRTVPEIQNYERYILRLDKIRDRLLEEAVKAELKAAEAREAYLEASRDRKVLDKVKEHRQREYREEFLAEETGLLDDLAGGAHARSRVNQGRQG